VIGDEVVVARIRSGRRHLFAECNIAAPWQQGKRQHQRRSSSVPQRRCALPFSCQEQTLQSFRRSINEHVPAASNGRSLKLLGDRQ